MKLLLVWGLAGVAFAVLWLLRQFGVIDGMDGVFYGLGICGYMLGITAATWALVDKPKGENTRCASGTSDPVQG